MDVKALLGLVEKKMKSNMKARLREYKKRKEEERRVYEEAYRRAYLKALREKARKEARKKVLGGGFWGQLQTFLGFDFGVPTKKKRGKRSSMWELPGLDTPDFIGKGKIRFI